MKLATFVAPKIISRLPSPLKLACIDPTSSRVKHQLCHHSSQHHKAQTRSTRKKLLVAESEDNSSAKSQLQSLLTGELSDNQGQGASSGKNVHVHVAPKGFIAVLVGPELCRFVIPISFLMMPELRAVMETVADECDCHYDGAIEIPCEEHYFEEILRTCLARHKNTK